MSKFVNNQDAVEYEDHTCQEKFLSWICCESQSSDEDLNPTNDGFGSDGNDLPGYLNRFQYAKDKAGFSDDSSEKSGCRLKRKSGSIGGKSINSDAMNSECDSGLGSSSDSGRRSKDQSDASETSDAEKSADEEKPAEHQPTVTLEQIKANFGRKPKRTESTLSRFSSIFSNDGRKLTDVLVEEFRLNDRFSGLSMDRIWGGFMEGIKEEDEDAKANSKKSLETIEEHMTPDTRAKRALNEKRNQRRRRKRPQKCARKAETTSQMSGSNYSIEFYDL